MLIEAEEDFVTDLRNLATNVGALTVSGFDLAVSYDGFSTRLGNVRT